MNIRTLGIMSALLAATAAMAVETKTWTEREAADFEKARLTGVALSTDGALTLAPPWKQLHDAGVPHLWAVARDAQGRTYAGGSDGKVFVIDAKAKVRVLATLEGGAVYALTCGKGGEVYAAVSPGGKIYRVEANGTARLFTTLKANYVWALVWGSDGALHAATGDPGQIQRIDATGKATVVFDSGETHVRALAAGKDGVFIAGTEPGGVVLRVSAKGEGFVLYQTARREVTALAVAADGTVYAAASGARAAATAPQMMVAPPMMPPQAAQAAAAPQAGVQAAVRPNVVVMPPTLVATPAAGGSDVYQIAPDGAPRRVWSHQSASAYALALGADGKLLIGTGNEGRIFRVDSAHVSTRLIDAEAAQITAFAQGAGGAIVAVTANPGQVFQLGPGVEAKGTIESDVFDAGAFTYWGRLRHESDLNGGSVKLEARSGNTEAARQHWSPWAEASDRISAPPARYLAWRATLTASPAGASPVLKLVEAAYQAKNLAPVIERIEITPANHKFQGGGGINLIASKTLNVPGVGQPRHAGAPQQAGPQATETGQAQMNYEKGWVGARWRVLDPNGDSLTSTVEIRGVEEKDWKPLKKELKDTRASWDATAFADGRYHVRVTVSDEADNFPGQGLSASGESDEFTIDNTPPEVSNLTARVEGEKLVIRFHAADALSALQSAEYSVNGAEWVEAMPTTRMTDSPAHDYVVELPKPATGEITVAVKVVDERDNVVVKKVVVR
jgi:outer membrane protein assembly factor BamB